MMNPEIKQKWVQALRSGDYQPSLVTLKNSDNQFSCLGVLCDILKDDLNGYWDKNDKFVTPNFTRSATLPPDLLDYCNLQDPNPHLHIELNGKPVFKSITELYSIVKLNFNQLAILIEEQL